MEFQSEKTDYAMTSTWGLLGLAVTLEVVGVLGLRFSQGFTLVLPTVIALAAFASALYVVSGVMKVLPMSIAYPVWAGGGTAGVAIVGVLALGESLSTTKALGIVLVVVGVIVVNMVSEKTGGC